MMVVEQGAIPSAPFSSFSCNFQENKSSQHLFNAGNENLQALQPPLFPISYVVGGSLESP